MQVLNFRLHRPRRRGEGQSESRIGRETTKELFEASSILIGLCLYLGFVQRG